MIIIIHMHKKVNISKDSIYIYVLGGGCIGDDDGGVSGGDGDDGEKVKWMMIQG